MHQFYCRTFSFVGKRSRTTAGRFVEVANKLIDFTFDTIGDLRTSNSELCRQTVSPIFHTHLLRSGSQIDKLLSLCLRCAKQSTSQ